MQKIRGDLSLFAQARVPALNGWVTFLVFALSSLSAASAQSTLSSERNSRNVAVVPFVGCPADGQVGPLDAPKAKSKKVQISKKSAERLAYYKAEQGPGVLGPRGWYCFETYGSDGGSLYLSPKPIGSANLLSSQWKGFTGPAIQLSAEDGGTSGRFGVARVIARLFPSHEAFVRKVIADGFGTAKDFPSGSYPKDRLSYKSKNVVEYRTPGEAEGLGTSSRLQKNGDPIYGVVILTGPKDEPSTLSLHIRLPAPMLDLVNMIVQETEHEAESMPNR